MHTLSNVYRISSISSDAAATIFFRCSFLCDYNSRAAFISLKARRHQRRLDRVRTNETVTIARHCQWYAQPLSPADSRGNDSYNTNGPSPGVVTIVRNYSHT